MMSTEVAQAPATILLPDPPRHGRWSLEEALRARRSVRAFRDMPLSEGQLSQLLFAAQGITGPDGARTAPSAGALYPLELYLALPEGLYHYDPARHELRRHAGGDLRRPMRGAALDQDAVLAAPAVFVIAVTPARVERKYGPARTPRYVDMEAGHVAQNLLLQAVAMGLGGVPVAAFDDDALKQVLALPTGQRPLYLIPVGTPA